MADANSTRDCAQCANNFEYPATSNRTKYCSTKCNAEAVKPRKKSYESRTCSISGCGSKLQAKGLCSKHYSRARVHGDGCKEKEFACECCGEVFKLPLSHRGPAKYCSHKCASKKPYRKCGVSDCHNDQQSKGYCSKHYTRLSKYGDPLGKAPIKRVCQPCGWCGATMSQKPSEAKKYKTCSRTCGRQLAMKNQGLESRTKTFICHGCHQEATRHVRVENDSGKFCSKECAYTTLTLVSKERSALRRIGQRRRDKEAEIYNSIVKPEIEALARIQGNIKSATKDCMGCGKRFMRRRRFNRFCSDQCQQDHKAKTKAEYKTTDAYRTSKRIRKARRRAVERSANADNIDPIAVFERDKWRCHICGDRTLKSKRGTTHDRAPELEHIISLADGGTHTWGNVACACRICNRIKGANSMGQIAMQIAC